MTFKPLPDHAIGSLFVIAAIVGILLGLALLLIATQE
jgi:hypothetical protein